MKNRNLPLRGFTLIELLVVITIIAILAAILFPVFAQAKLAAKKTTDLSNIKNLALAHQMYWADSDDTAVSVYMTHMPGDFNYMIYPYVKNVDILQSPTVNTPMSAYVACNGVAADWAAGGRNNPYGATTMYGYGYNGGQGWSDGSGMAYAVSNQPQGGGNGGRWFDINIAGRTIQVQYQRRLLVGKNASSLVSPATTLLLGNSPATWTKGMHRDTVLIPRLLPNPEMAYTNACRRAYFAGWQPINDGITIAFADGHAAFQKYDTTLWTIQRGQTGVIQNTAGQIYPPAAASEALTAPKVFRDPCIYFTNYDGGNNPGGCKTNGVGGDPAM